MADPVPIPPARDRVLAMIDVDPDTVADGKVPRWDALAGKHLYVDQAAGGGGGSPGGTSGQVQFNDAGAFGGDAGLTFDAVTDALTVGGSVTSPTIQGSTASGGNLAIQSTSHATKGTVDIQGVNVSSTGKVIIPSASSTGGLEVNEVVTANHVTGLRFGNLWSVTNYSASFYTLDNKGVSVSANRQFLFSGSNDAPWQAKDTGLARESPGVVRVSDGSTGQGVILVSALWHSGTSVATTLGSVVRRMPIYDAVGTLLGYIPIYDDIT